MLDKEMELALNTQINHELASAQIYLSMSAYFESENLPGFAKWMYAQYQEETAHAMKFFGYINDRGGRVLLKTIEGPRTEWSSPIDAFTNTLEHERMISSRIHNLADLAISKRDHATNNFLQWFISEQVEEEATASSILDQLKMIEGSKSSLFLLDKEYGSRVFNATAE